MKSVIMARCVVAVLLMFLAGSTAAPAPSTLAAGLEASGLTVLLAAVKNFPDLVAAATNESTIVTLFAPSNDALLGAVKALGEESLEGLVKKYPVGDILKYHIVPASVKSTALKHGKAVSTLLGKRLIPDLKASKSPIIRGFNSAANVTKADIIAGKCYIHIIDAVLLPLNPVPAPYTNVAEAATAANLTSLVAAVTKAGLVATIADPKLEATILAPTDAAFSAALTTLGLTSLDSIPVNILTQVLQYHVAPGYGPTVRMVADGSVKTLLTNQTLSWAYSAGSSIPSIKAASSTAKIVTPNVFAGKSVIHIIDTVLLPKM